ncbi:glycosyltransferase involved in cell wall biosynthesis [Mycetocola sp. BIGb0189]|uniref:glycosyltransferase family 4 protein n=1 Tax=Mycetocola sp. BIGb0189 TaxID=2940604 RepID=UPI0021683B4A|nr:glycosyltransferase family 1 protein [Mycetocola sp. BIGb0189]MCS4277427.1 glycosyltransferase involved in cell wall biosynthesis [Mycetocola sp. BIGb0189]
MKILFDARYIRTDFHDGISRYSASLAAALSELTPVTFLIHDPAQRDSLPADADTLLIHAPTSWREPFTARILNRYRPDVVFSAMQTIGAAGRRFGLVLTLHDMIYYRHRTPPKNLAWPIRLGWRVFHLSYLPQRITLNAADVVATVSETSKADFERVKLTRRPVVVIPNAPQPRGDAPLADTSRAPRNLVYMGSFMPYKNVETLIRAMGDLPEHTLHLLSRITPERRAELEELIPTGASVIFHNGVTDAEYEAMLQNRAILVTASKDEGYGLPVAEALELGVPAVISDMPIFREVAGDGALYFDVNAPSQAAARILELDDDARRAELVAAGTAHIKTFSWARSAQTLLTTLEAIHEHRSTRP